MREPVVGPALIAAVLALAVPAALVVVRPVMAAAQEVAPPKAKAAGQPAKKVPPAKAVAARPAGKAADVARPGKGRPAAVPPPPPPPELRVGVEGAYPPFSEVAADGKGLKGFDIDVANALCEELKARCELVRQDWERIQDGLLARETDLVVASLSMTDERRQRYAFTDKYYGVPAKFVARKGAPPVFPAGRDAAAAPTALSGVRVGVQERTAQADALVERYAGAAEILRYPSLPAALDALARGEVRLVLGDALALELGFLKTPEGEGYEFVGPGLADPARFGEGIGVAVRKEDEGLRSRLNEAIGRLRASGRYQELAGRYFGFDIYGGDALPPPQHEPYYGQGPFVPRRTTLPELVDGPTGGRRG